MTRARSRRPSRPSLAIAALAATAALLCGVSADADLLVTRDGSVVETRGAWRVQGKLVIFELPGGQLSSMQLAEVDLDASRAAMEKAEAAAEKPPAAAPPEREAVLVLTDADVRPATPVGEAAAGGPAEEEAAAAPAQRLVVSSWDEASGTDGLVFTGELVNESAEVAANIQLGVLLYDREGELQETVLANVTSPVLQPGQRARFRAEAPGVFEYSALRFEAQSLGLAVGEEQDSSSDEE